MIQDYPPSQVDIFMKLATKASYKAVSTCRRAMCAAEDAWLLSGNFGPVIQYKGILVYKDRTLAEKTAIVHTQVRKKMDHMTARRALHY